MEKRREEILAVEATSFGEEAQRKPIEPIKRQRRQNIVGSISPHLRQIDPLSPFHLQFFYSPHVSLTCRDNVGESYMQKRFIGGVLIASGCCAKCGRAHEWAAA